MEEKAGQQELEAAPHGVLGQETEQGESCFSACFLLRSGSDSAHIQDGTALSQIIVEIPT